MRLLIEKIIYPGKSLGRQNGKIVFTDEGLPGEEIEIVSLREKKNYTEAETVEIIKPSPHRVQPHCAHYKVCSGYQYIDYPFQVKIKEDQLKEILSAGNKFNLPEIKFRTASKIWNYRNKIDFNIIWEDEIPYAAYNLHKQQEQFIKIKECFLASEQINKIIPALIEIIAQKNIRAIKKVSIRESINTGKMLLVLRCNIIKDAGIQAQDFMPLTKNFALDGIVCAQNEPYKQDVVLGNNFIEEKINDMSFHIGADSFFQINLAMLDKLIPDLKNSLSLTGKETIADLYCGVGTFGITLAPYAAKIIGVELEKENVHFLKRNILLNGLNNFVFYKETCEQWVGRLPNNRVDVLIIDPPRKGMGSGLCTNILKSGVPSIAYISCNPSTMARDLKELLEGYTIKHLFAYDFFPHTPHIEILAVLEK
ncbi:MAG: 23S rRNA (uracil(1939)-C(5))-methyltransferase RlmD [Candidatus Omnitrophota bacterium]